MLCHGIGDAALDNLVFIELGEGGPPPLGLGFHLSDALPHRDRESVAGKIG